VTVSTHIAVPPRTPSLRLYAATAALLGVIGVGAWLERPPVLLAVPVPVPVRVPVVASADLAELVGVYTGPDGARLVLDATGRATLCGPWRGFAGPFDADAAYVRVSANGSDPNGIVTMTRRTADQIEWGGTTFTRAGGAQ
jgi:hypothetical protein